MLSAWTIGINIIARSNAGRVFGKMGKEAQVANKEVQGLHRNVNASQTGIRAVGMALNVVGIAGAATVAIGIKGAAELQDAYAQTGVAMGKSTEWVKENFQKTAMAMSQSTAQSITDSMGLLRVMATSGINDPSQMKALAMPIAQFADTQYLGKNHTSFDDSTKLAVKIAHQFGARTASELKPILNALFKISQDMPDSLKSAGTQLKYYAAKYTERGVTATEVLKLQATLDRLGYGEGKSGTGMYQIYRNLLSPNKKQGIAQDQLGISGTNIIGGDGTFHVENLLNKLSSDYEAARRSKDPNAVKKYDQELNRAFTSNAALIAGVLSSHAGRSQYKNVEQTMNRVHNLQEAQVQLMATLNSQTKVLATNFKSLAAMLAQPLIPALTKLVSNTATLVGNLANYFNAHPHQAAAVGVGLSALGVATLINFLRGEFIRGIFLHIGKSIPGVNIGGGVYGRMGREGAGVAARNARLGVVASDAVGNGFFSGIMRFVSPLTKVVGTLASKFMGPLGIVSSILLFGDAVKLLQNHSFDIGKSLGKATEWIERTGGPNLSKAITDAFVNAIANLIPAIGKALVGVTDRISDIVVESPGKLIDAAVRGVKGFNTGRYGIDPHRVGSAPLGPRLPMAPRIGPLPHGGVPNPGFGLHLPAPVVNHFHFHAAAGTNDATSRRQAMVHGREVAKQVANVMGQVGRTATRAAGQTIASARMSSFETTSSYS